MSQLFDFSLGKKPWEKTKNKKPRENQKTKTFQRMFGLRLMFGFLVFLEFFSFLVMTLKKLKKLKAFFCFLKELLLEVRQKKQKNSGLFWFFAWVVVTCLLEICPKTKKDLSFFGFLPYFK